MLLLLYGYLAYSLILFIIALVVAFVKSSQDAFEITVIIALAPCLFVVVMFTFIWELFTRFIALFKRKEKDLENEDN